MPTPAWRKILISGSNAHVHEITSSGIVTTPALSPMIEEKVLIYNTSSGAFYYTGSYGSGGGGGEGTPGGSDTEIQFNDGGAFAGTGSFTFNKDTFNVVTHGSLIASGTDATPSVSSIQLHDDDQNPLALLARVGSGTNSHRGRIKLFDQTDFTSASIQLSTSGNSWISSSLIPAKLGIGTFPSHSLSVIGIISASGAVDASGYGIAGVTVASTTGGDFLFGNALADTNLLGLTITLDANITASGAISSSGVGTFASLDISGDIDVDGTTNLDAVDIDGNVQLDGTFTVGANDQGYDVTLFGDTSNRRVLWDTSADHLKLFDDTKLVFGTGANDADFDASIYWNQTDLVIDSESDLQLLSDVNVTGNITASGAISSSGTGSFNRIEAGNSYLEPGKLFASNIVGTLTTVAQGNITSVGTLGSLTVTGDITANGNIVGDDGTDITNIETIECDTITHDGDGDTKISFGTNSVGIKAGNTTVFASDITGSKLSNVKSIEFNTSSAALSVKGAIGDIVKFGGSTTIAGGMYYLNNSGGWTIALADSTFTSTSSIAVAVGDNSTTDGMCLRGFSNPQTDPGAGTGNPVYLSDTLTGRMTSSPPSSSGDVVRIVGHQYGTDLIYFNPSSDYILHA